MTHPAPSSFRPRTPVCLLAWLPIGGAAATEAPGTPPGAPVVAATIALSARPEALAVGRSGPFNRLAFDVLNFQPANPAARLLCIYPRELAYQCDFELAPDAADGPRRRIIVTIPDLGWGSRVLVHLTNGRGTAEVAVELANGSHTVHEIEALPLPEGGRVATGSQGTSVPVTQLATQRATTTPAMAAAFAADARQCDRIVPHWIGASVTDPVFTSPFGALNGSVLLARPAPAGRPVQRDSLPEWLITYPLSATRVQFIAHYEVIYRVGVCPERIVRA